MSDACPQEQSDARARAGVDEGRAEGARRACARVLEPVAGQTVRDDVVSVVRGFDPARMLRHLHLAGGDRKGILDRDHGPAGLHGGISAGAPKLGRCWDGAPHSWLGLASTVARFA